MRKTTQPEAAGQDDWSPPKPRGDGVYVCGDGLPLNHRLRAEELVRAGDRSDPGGMISDEMIAETAERLKAAAALSEIPADPAGRSTGQ